MAKVIVYSTPICPYCTMAKDFLKKNKVSFEEIDVAANPEKGREMVEKSRQYGVPVIDIGGKLIVGFNKEAIIKALNL